MINFVPDVSGRAGPRKSVLRALSAPPADGTKSEDGPASVGPSRKSRSRSDAATLEAGRFTNTSAMMLMAHPMHVHGPQFPVLSRSVQPAQAAIFATVAEGLLDGGWKDTVFVMPGEHVTILNRTSACPALDLLHCHDLEHEDMGMMGKLRLEKACPADVNDDGAVNAADLAALLGAWGASGSACGG